MAGLITLVRHRLQESRTDALAYGAKDTGDMGGGAAGAILLAAGPRVFEAVREQLATTPRQVGTVVVTDSFDLAARGVKWICHIVSIIKHTPQGAWCPHPDKLEDGVYEALRQAASRGAHSITISALGTGEGRVPPQEAARRMTSAARRYLQEHKGEVLDIEFSLPNFRDHEAFAAALKR